MTKKMSKEEIGKEVVKLYNSFIETRLPRIIASIAETPQEAYLSIGRFSFNERADFLLFVYEKKMPKNLFRKSIDEMMDRYHG